MEKTEKSDNHSIKSTSNFYLLFSNMKETRKLLNSYKKFINEYYEALSGFYKQLTEVNSHFLIEEKFKSSVINSPIFKLGKSIKKAMSAQINKLFSIITDDTIFYAFNKSLSDLSNILQESIVIYDKKTYGQNIRPLARSLIQAYEEIESKVIDNYIRKNYNKHLKGLNDVKLETNVEHVQFLEKTFMDFEEGTKLTFFNNLNEMEIKTIKMLNKIKNNIDNIILTVKSKGNDYLDILQKEINSIWEVGVENENKFKNKKEGQKGENFELKKNKDFDKFRYKLKVICQPIFQVEDDPEIEPNIKSEKRNKTEPILSDENELTLNDEDIYNVVSTIYNYDLKLLNKSDYNLETEQEKIKVKYLTKKLMSFNIAKNIKEEITEAEVNELYDLLNNIDNLVKFFYVFNNIRAKGKFQLTKRVYDIIINIFKKAQDYLLKDKERSLENLIIILSQTFFILKNGKKVYLEEETKHHPLFTKQEFWEDHINNSINNELNKYEKQHKNIKIEIPEEFYNNKIKEIVFAQLFTFLNYITEFDMSKEMKIRIINPIIEKYNLEEHSKLSLFSFLEQTSNKNSK